MNIQNNTAVDYWFGPIRLPANGTITLDDITETSVYLTDDGVADAINTLALSNKITVTGANPIYPRATGVPSVLHGDGAPEGLVYAPQGSLYLRRDSLMPTSSLYVKNSGVTQNTGWAIIGISKLNVLAPVLTGTSSVSVTSTSASSPTSVIGPTASIYSDGSTAITVEFYAPRVDSPGGAANVNCSIALLQDSTVIVGRWWEITPADNEADRAGCSAIYTFTPTSGTHTYQVGAWVSSGTGTIWAAGGGTGFGPMFLRVYE